MENNDSTFINFANLISTLSPIEFTTLGVIVGYVLTISLDIQTQNSLGNWFELVGQILLTASAQGSATLTNEEYNKLVSDVELLKKIVLKKI
mgnify:CR=1 FL=1